MNSKTSKTAQFLSRTIIPVICSIILGLMLCGAYVFNRYSTAYQFIQTPIIASVFYSLLALGKRRDTYVGLFVLLVLTFVSTQSTTAIFITRDLLYFAAIVVAVYLYFKYFRQSAHINPFYAAITLAGLYATTSVITSEIQLAIIRDADPHSTRESAYSVATVASFYGSAIGFAVGAGITLADKSLGELEYGFIDPF